MPWLLFELFSVTVSHRNCWGYPFQKWRPCASLLGLQKQVPSWPQVADVRSFPALRPEV